MAYELPLVRGNARSLIIPFAHFPASGDGTRPDFERLSFTDHGRTVVLGDYEAAVDAILYDFDPEYRRRQKKKMHSEEQSFGASLRRLRKQRRLGRDDFGKISAKEIARIERGEVKKPQAHTLKVIAEKLGVLPEDIETF